LTHNIFDYGDPGDFRRETLLGVIDAVRRIFEQNDCELATGTAADIAAAYREAVPASEGDAKLELDTRGRGAWKSRRIGE
jgi:hypothetical protein